MTEEQILARKLQALRPGLADICVFDDPTFDLFTQLICLAYTQHLFRERPRLFPYLLDVPEDMRNGYRGLSLHVLVHTTGGLPHLTAPRVARRNKSEYDEAGFELTYNDKLTALFDYRRYNPTWAKEISFRRRTRQLHDLIKKELGPEWAALWLDDIGVRAAVYLRVAGAYD